MIHLYRRFINNLKKQIKTDRTSFVVYSILRTLVLIIMIRCIFTRNFESMALCAVSLILFLMPALLETKLKIEIPTLFEIIIYLFIFSAEILGEISHFYVRITFWDTMLHTLNGFLCAAVGFSLIDILNRKSEKIDLSPLYLSLVAFCFSMTIGVMWEFFEFGMDEFVRTDMQKDTVIQSISTVSLHPERKNVPVILNNIKNTIIQVENKDGSITEYEIEGGYLDIGIKDTMHDLIVNFVGAVVFSIIGLLYIKNRDEYKFAENFIPVMRQKKKENKEPEEV